MPAFNPPYGEPRLPHRLERGRFVGAGSEGRGFGVTIDGSGAAWFGGMDRQIE
jgi:hypothetical protein